jgi:hypothetical protein
MCGAAIGAFVAARDVAAAVRINVARMEQAMVTMECFCDMELTLAGLMQLKVER